MTDRSKKRFWLDWSTLEKSQALFDLFLVLFTGGLLWTSIKQWQATKQGFQAVQRAFVFTKGIQIGRSLDANRAFLMIPIENTGTTPATHVTVIANRRFTKYPLPDDFDFPDARGGPPGLLAPKEVGAGPVLVTTQRCIDLVHSDKLRLFVWGRINYADVFQVQHETDFCWEYRGTWGAGLNPNPTQMGDWFTTCARHNCADKDCAEYQMNRRVEEPTDQGCKEIS